MSAPWLLISESASFDGRFGIAFPFHGEGFGRERLDDYRIPFDANAGAVGDCPVFMGAFVDAFHKLTFGLSFQRLAAGVIANCCRRVVHKWSTERNRTLGWF